MNLDSFGNELDMCFDEIENEIEMNRKKMHNDTYEVLQLIGLDYLKRNNNQLAICIVYEAFIYFVIHEEYEKCTYIKALLNNFREYLFANSKLSRTTILNELNEDIKRI